jgi:hypothetical protein
MACAARPTELASRRFSTYLLPPGFLAARAIAWRWELAGAVVLVALGAYYVLSTRGRFPSSTYLLIAGPPVLIGLLLLVHGLLGTKRGPKRGPDAAEADF